MPDCMIGETISHYRVAEKIGQGGMGEVFRAYDEHLDRDVAIKVLPPGSLGDESSRKRFHQEALALSKLNHPNVATIHDFDTQQGIDFLVMEYIPGLTLTEKLAHGPLREEEVVSLGLQLAEGLQAAHEHGVIHRDLKPGNLRLSEGGRLKILDFGLAKLQIPVTATAVTASFSATQTVAGTLPYMAPEQVLGEPIDARTDIFAAGLVLYEMATGKRAFPESQGGHLVVALVRESPIAPRNLNPKLSTELERIVEKCVEKDPENRYQSAKELAVDLRRLEHEAGAKQASGFLRVPAGPSFGRRMLGLTIALVILLAAVVAILPRLRRWQERPATQLPRYEALAVLPLVDLSGDPAREYFADGMTEELITQLGKLTTARVISRQSVMQFKGTNLPLAEIAHKLNVSAVVEGSVLQSGSRVRVTARLIDAAAEKPVWTEEYERELRDVLSLQAEVTHAIASEIRMKLNPQEQARPTLPRAVNPEAYEAYLRGQAAAYKISKSGFDEAQHYFQFALERDPTHAPAYAGLAFVWLMRADAGYEAPSETMPKAKAAARRALELDDTLSEAYVNLANIEGTYDRDWSAAERDFRRALELNPNNANAHFMYADYLISFKRNQEWQTEMQQAVNLNPILFRCFYGWHLIYLGRYDEAIDVLQKVSTAQPNFSSAHLGLWGAYFRKHMDKEGLEEAVKFYGALPDQEAIVAALKYGYQQGGYREGMKRAADTLAGRALHSYVPRVRIARLYAHAGDANRTLSWLEKAYEARETPLVHLGVGWDWEQLHADPRFQDLLRRMKLSQ